MMKCRRHHNKVKMVKGSLTGSTLTPAGLLRSRLRSVCLILLASHLLWIIRGFAVNDFRLFGLTLVGAVTYFLLTLILLSLPLKIF